MSMETLIEPIYQIPIPSATPAEGWESSPWAMFTRASNQAKGKTGVQFVLAYLKSQGVIAKSISNKGDILEDESQIKSEVKTALLKIQGLSEKFWWNQLRPLQSGWKVLYLVGIYPTKVKIWKFEREEALKLAALSKALSHTGQDGAEKPLTAIGVTKNSKKNTFNLLETYGTLVAEISASDIALDVIDETEDE